MRRNSPRTGRPSISSDHLLRQVALGDRRDDARDLVRRRDEVADELVHRAHPGCPRALRGADRGALGHPALLADDLRDAQELARDVLVELEDVVQDLACARQDAVAPVRQPDGEVAPLHRLQHLDELLDLVLARPREEIPFRDAPRAHPPAPSPRPVPIRRPRCRSARIAGSCLARAFLRPEACGVHGGRRGYRRRALADGDACGARLSSARVGGGRLLRHRSLGRRDGGSHGIGISRPTANLPHPSW